MNTQTQIQFDTPGRQHALPGPELWHSEDTTQTQLQMPSVFTRLSYHLYSIWLFTRSDLKTIVGPSAAFAVINYHGCAAFGIERPQRTTFEHLSRVLQVVLWLWVNLLPFNISNQRRSIDEDLENKPWRTLPSRRMAPGQATVVMLVMYPLAILFSIFVGSHLQSLALVGFGFWYNDLGGADNSWFIRNFINACGFICFISGALQIMLKDSAAETSVSAVPYIFSATATIFTNSKLCAWLAVVGNIVLSTIQTQDMYDQVGDLRHGRQSMPLVLGDQFTRWTIAILTLFWSWYCPRFWSLPCIDTTPQIILGTIIAWRTLSNRSVTGDRMTFKIWNLWLVSLYCLPLTRTLLFEEPET